MKNNKDNIKNFIYHFKITLFVFYIFFFDLGLRVFEINKIIFTNIDSRLILILILPFLIFEMLVLKPNKNYFLKLFFFPILITTHWIYLNFFNYFDIDIKGAFKFFLSIIYIIIFSFYLEFLKKNLLKIIELFFLIYFLVILANTSYNYFNSQQVCIFGCFSKTRQIFKEASHLAYIAPLIYVYYLNIVPLKKIHNFYKFLLVFFIISTSQNLSTTLLASVISSLFLILLFNFNEIKNKKKFLIILLLFVLLVPFHKDTLLKINQFYDISFHYNKYQNFFYAEQNKNGSETFFSEERKILSNEVYITNTKLSIHSLKENLLGWGLHNYKYAHNFYISGINNSNLIGTAWLNSTDGANNLNKGLVEFGVLFFIPIILLFVILIDKKVDIQAKLLVFPILFSQIFIRGSGFFNGGFIIFFIILISLYINKLYEKSI